MSHPKQQRATSRNLFIREATTSDFHEIWPFFSQIVAAGETYGYDMDTDFDQGCHIWIHKPQKSFVAELEGKIVGTYFITANHDGPGAHVCNCGYMVDPATKGLGIATAMCEHSQSIAIELGYKAMQFNFVACSNTRAVKLWLALGFTQVGTLPNAFKHPTLGYVDALVIYKWLTCEVSSEASALPQID